MINRKATAAAVSALIATLSLPLGASAQTALEPTAVTGDARMVTYPYDEDRTYKVLIRPKNSTQIKLAKDEKVNYVSAGDTTNFVITVPNSHDFVLVKPKFEGITTNLLVVTNKRSYHIDLQSTAEGKKWYMRVAWLYEESDTLDLAATPGAALQGDGVDPGVPRGSSRRSMRGAGDEAPLDEEGGGLRPENIAFGYKILGGEDLPFRPTQVFDDKLHTYVRMPEGLQELPALFTTDPDTGESTLVNYSVRPPYLVAQRVMTKFVLKLGKAEVAVEKPVPKKSWFNFGNDGR